MTRGSQHEVGLLALLAAAVAAPALAAAPARASPQETPPTPLAPPVANVSSGSVDTLQRAGFPITGFSAEMSSRQKALEEILIERIVPDSLARWARGLAAESHLAGTPAQRFTKDSVVAWLEAGGLEVGYDSLVLYLPMPLHVSLERLRPEPVTLTLREPPVPSDPATWRAHVPVFNAYSASGIAEGEVVFANYGLPGDYRTLDSMGVSVAGRVVVARYGRSFRGIKAREAAARGAAALVLYSDPDGDGFRRGEVYPDGPMRPPAGVQRGSVLNAIGDPSTPRGPSLPGARRVGEDEMVGTARIPVIPVGYGAVGELLRYLGGDLAPEAWQGGLLFPYRVGPGPVMARVEVRNERGDEAYHPAFNTIGALRGVEWPEEWVIIGAHRDAWSPGSIDNVSGTASVVAVARALAAAADQGYRPRRSVIFATWDAEEWGVIGSAEWVEANADRLRSSAVAYLNQDAVVSGPRFGAGAAPELKAFLREVTRQVVTPQGGLLFDAWLAMAAEGTEGPDRPREPPVGDLGGGSDHRPFYQHLGIPAAGFGFSGPGGVYHSMYDTPSWMERFGDPGYEYHAVVARVAAVAVARLANADVLPFDHAGMAELIGERSMHLRADVLAAIRGATAEQHTGAEAALVHGIDVHGAEALRAALADLDVAIDAFRRGSDAWERARESLLSAGIPDPQLAASVNASVRGVAAAMTTESGLPGDSWSRQLLFTADPDNGYAPLALPAVRLALRRGDLGETERRIRELSAHLREATAALQQAERSASVDRGGQQE